MFHWSQENLVVDIFASWCSPLAELPAGTNLLLSQVQLWFLAHPWGCSRDAAPTL